MWERIECKNIFEIMKNDNNDSNLEFFPLISISNRQNTIDCTEEQDYVIEIEQLILNNIDIQYTVSLFYRSYICSVDNNEKESVFNYQQQVIGILDEQNYLQQAERAAKIFGKVVTIRQENRVVGIRVSKVNRLAIMVFEDLMKRQLINKWIRFVTEGEDIQDVDVVTFKYVKDTILIDDEKQTLFKNDPFINYIICKSDGLETKCLRLPGTLESAMNAQLVCYFADIVDELYLFTMVDINGKTGEKKYTKYITWAN